MTLSTAIDASAVARVVGIQTVFKDLRAGSVLLLPQRLALLGQGATASTYSTTKAQYTSADAVGAAYGRGSPLHLAARQLLPANGDGIGSIPLTIYPLEDDASGVVATGDITPSGTQTVAASYIVRVNNIDSAPFVISAGDSVAARVTAMTAAINANLNMPVIAADGVTKVNITTKWKGVSANAVTLEVIGSTTAGTSFAFTQPAGGLVNPSIDAALAQIGNVWETMLLNCLDIADTTALGALSTFGDGRWGATVRKPLVAFTGNTATTVSSATAVSDARKTDETNAQLVAPGSSDLPFVVAARQLVPIIKTANNNPARDYGSQPATGLVPGTDGVQWTYADRDSAVKKGSSTIEVRDSVVYVSDVVTFYHPAGEAIPPYRFVCDIVKLQNILFNMDITFATAEWDGAPLLPDDQPTTNPDAKKPKSAVAAACAVIDSLGLEALISDPATAKANTFAEIDSGNPKRMNLSTTVQVAGNNNIFSMDLNWGFFFGTSEIVG